MSDSDFRAARMRRPSISSQVTSERANPTTPGVWLVALLPATPWLVALITVTVTRAPISWPFLIFLLVAAAAGCVAAAIADQRKLDSRGFEPAASPLWAVISMAYLSIRTRAFGRVFYVNYPFWVNVLSTPAALMMFLLWSAFVIRVG